MSKTPRWIATFDTSRATRIGVALAAALLALVATSGAHAQLPLAYSFEDGDFQGFNPNGGGITLDLDTIGATDGMGSLKVDIVAGATFVGALSTILPLELADPPGVDKVTFDVTITEAFAGEGFVRAGITIFGGGGGQFGLQAQFQLSEVNLDGLDPGTYPVEIALDRATHPLTFEPNQSFNQIFGGEGPNDLIPTGFQIYVNKSNTAPWTGYIDNIRLMPTPVLDADFNDSGLVDGVDLGLWRPAFATTAGGDADGDGDSDGFDFVVWQRQLGTAGAPVAAVPEPATAGLAGLCVAGALVRRRSRYAFSRRL